MTNRDIEERLRPHIAHVVNLGLDDPDAILTAREQALRDLADAALTLLRRERPNKDEPPQTLDRNELVQILDEECVWDVGEGGFEKAPGQRVADRILALMHRNEDAS